MGDRYQLLRGRAGTIARMAETHKASILDGRAVGDKLITNVAHAVANGVKRGERPPGLAVVLIGDDPASDIYVGNKVKACARDCII